MRLLKTGLAAALASVVIAQAHAMSQQAWHDQPHEAKQKSVAAGDAALLRACAPEIATLIADARKQGATIKDADIPLGISEMITNWWWGEYATSGIRAEYKNRPRRKEEGEIMYAFTQCAIATIDAWKLGVRDPAQLRSKWKPTPAAPAASKPAASSAQGPQGDAAAYAEFTTSCSAQIGKMKATLVSKGEKVSDAEFKQFFEPFPAQMRDIAKREGQRPDAAFYRLVIADMTKTANAPGNTDPSEKLILPVAVCFLETLIRRESGSSPANAGTTPAPNATRTPAAPVRPSAPAAAPVKPAPSARPAAPAGNDDTYAYPVDCVRVSEGGGSFRNVCDFPVYFTYCGVNPAKDSWIVDCNKQSFGLDGIAAKGIQGGFTRAEMVYMFACKKYRTPKDVKFIPGKGLYGTCKQ